MVNDLISTVAKFGSHMLVGLSLSGISGALSISALWGSLLHSALILVV
jgi:hypothetical protein